MKKGKLTVIGVGYHEDHITLGIEHALSNADVILGHEKIVETAQKFIPPTARYISDQKLREEAGEMNDLKNLRARVAVDLAQNGNNVVYISNGDPQIYSYALPIVEEGAERGVDVQVLPGISAVLAAGAMLGAPFRPGFAIIGLYEDGVEEGKIFNKIRCGVQGDFVLVILLPRHEIELYPQLFPERDFSHLYPIKEKAGSRLLELQRLLLEYLPQSTPIAIVTLPEEPIITSLDKFHENINRIKPYSTLIIGNKNTICNNNKFITRR
jgi:precorrin-3B methylase